MKIGVAKKAPLDTEWNADMYMYMRGCEHRVYEVEIGDGGGITRKTEPGQAGPRERGGYAVRQLALGAAAARRWRGCGEAHVPGQAGPRERGGYALRVTRYGKPTTRFGCSGRLLVSAVRGPRNSRSPPGVAGSLSPRGARRAGGGAVTDTKALAKPLYRTVSGYLFR